MPSYPYEVDPTAELSQHDSQEIQTQQQTQSTQQTQQVSQPAGPADAHLFGYLQPCSATSKLLRVDFWKMHPKYKIGRNTELNNVVFPGFKVSNLHCEIMWDGRDTDSSVTVKDLSSNGTFINGRKIGKGATSILRNGNEIAFGTCIPQPQNDGLEDYRFLFRNTVAPAPKEGLHAYYDIHSELGKGSFATVVKAISRESGEWYAVKIIHGFRNTREGQDPNSRRTQFAREISIMEKMNHPNICMLKEVFIDPEPRGDIYLVLELVEGGDLLDYILNRNGLTEAQAQPITAQMCLALAYIHKQGVTHRDLKPENVLLTKDDPPIVKVADFGLAKVVDSLTMLRTMCGTPSYLAPEVVRQQNQEGYDNLVDSWSVGVIVFSMLTNSSPFIEDENQRDIRTRIAERRIDWSTLDSFSISAACKDFIRSLLEEHPKERMTLTGACAHPWLSLPPDESSQLTYIPRAAPPRKLSTVSSHSEESTSSFIDMKPLHINSSFGAHPIARDASRTGPLQRRSHVLRAAEANGGAGLPVPSQDMIAQAEAQEAALSQQVQETESQDEPQVQSQQQVLRKGQKRVHSELTPLPEDNEDDDVEADARPPPKNKPAPNSRKGSSSSTKKGRTSSEEDAGGAQQSQKRVTRNSNKATAVAEAPPAPTRRSARQPNKKQARRA